MTNGLKLFLAFYILVGQPALLGWMLNNNSLYELAGLNAGVFVIACLISALCKPKKPKAVDNTAKVIEKSEEKISRIENDNGVAVVSVEKKQEVVVERSNDENQGQIAEGLVENKEENAENKLEEKSEEKTEEKVPERPMRESVTIPKIVQPLSGHQTPKKKNRELKWGQRVILLLTLGIAAVITRTLWEFLGSRGVAIALFLGWILYLVIGKLFDVDGFYNAKKLFTNRLYIVLIIAGLGYGIYTMQDSASFNLVREKAVSYIKDQFKSENDGYDGVNEIYVFEGTGEVIADTGTDLDTAMDTGLVENETGTNTETGTLEDTQTTVDQPEVQPETETQVSPTDNPEREVNRGEALKHLLQGYTLSTKTNKSFTYVAKSNELYPYFKTAQEKAMIGTDVDPNKRISCETYMALKGILEGWNVNIYDKSQTRIIYWNKANELGKTNGCDRGGFVKVKNL